MGVAGKTSGPFPERYAKDMQISACEPLPAVRVRPQVPRSQCRHTRAFAPRCRTRSVAGRSSLSPPARPGRASPAPRTARSTARGGASLGPALRACGRGAPADRGALATRPPSPCG